MEKKFIIKDFLLGTYFTNDYENDLWSPNISEAYKYHKDVNMEAILEILLEYIEREGIQYLEIITVYVNT